MDKPSEALMNKVLPSDRAWFDPRLIGVVTRPLFRTVSVAMNTITLVAKPDPSRMFLLVATAAGGFGSGSLAPWSDPDAFAPFTFSASTSLARISLFEWPGLVQVGWYIFSAAAQSYRVVEVLRNG